MTNSIKNAFYYKLLGVILYFFSSLAGLSILFLYPPKYLLFNENSEEEKIKLDIYKDFAKNIYENINTRLIKNLTLTEDNESCPDNFEQLKIKNQYYGDFTKFYGNKSICIERLNNEAYSFKQLLKKSNYNNDNNKNKKECGEIIKHSNNFLYVPNEMQCPLNNIEINDISRAKKFGKYYYKMGPGDNYLTPIYGNNPKSPIITNIIIINNYKLCVEKENIIKNKLPCEFPDNNECFIDDDNFDQVNNLENSEGFKLFPNNLAKWNLAHDNNINHNYCREDLSFHIFTKGYINFNEKNLKEFEEEFPSSDFRNNPLNKAYKAYKSSKNIDNFFYLISYNLFIWSLIHFILQIMLYFEKKGIRKIYVRNGIILFFFKLFSFLGMIINFFCYYLKIEKVYLVMIDKPRNKILEYYSKTRRIFIIRIIIICLIGLFIICIDLIIYFFTLTIQWGVDFKREEKEIEIENNNQIINENHIIINNIEESFEEPHFSNFTNVKKEKPPIINSPVNEKTTNITKKDKKNLEEINLQFFFRENVSKSYLIKIGINDSFMKAIEILKETYSELKEKDMIVFAYESNIINKEKTIKENGLSDDSKIFIISK